jgi:peptide/nickel transport system substrate-binding protein
MVSIHMKKSVKPLDDLKVRQAIAHSINRDDYVQFFGRVFQPTFAPIPQEYSGALPKDKIEGDLLYEYDLDKAKKLLADAGFANGFKLETIISERTDYLNLAQIAQEQVAAIGIELKLNVVDHGSYVSGIIKDNKGSLVWSTASRFPSADSLLREFWLCAADVTKPTGVQNFALYCNPDFDAAYNAGVEAFEAADRDKHFEDAQLILLKDMPSVTIGALATAALRQGYVDLGYKVDEGKNILSLPYMYHLDQNTHV